jgi:hypothetical protein
VVLAATAICAGANLAEVAPVLAAMTDYLVLAFFFVILYYRERLAFIDLLVKRGVFFAAGLVILACMLAVRPQLFAPGWALLALGLWLLSPVLYTAIERTVDSLWLRRPHSAGEAERQFMQDIQAVDSADALRESASRSLGAIFRAGAQVRFGALSVGEPEEGGLSLHLEPAGVSILLQARADGIPFLSEDRRLLQSLAGALGVVRENVRFRADRRQQAEREQHLRLLAGRAELKALRAQINPHFLFNALSVIAGLTQYRPDLAAETIEELGQVFRYALRKTESEWAPLAEEVEFVMAYLHVEQARFGERLRVELSLDPAAGRVPIPAMTIQPVIENAIRHGISAREKGGVIGLRAVLQAEQVAVEVFDNGPGFRPGFSLDENGEGHGLRNVMDRLRGYYGQAASLSWENGSDGTRVVMAFPRSGRCEPCAC